MAMKTPRKASGRIALSTLGGAALTLSLVTMPALADELGSADVDGGIDVVAVQVDAEPADEGATDSSSVEEEGITGSTAILVPEQPTVTSMTQDPDPATYSCLEPGVELSVEGMIQGSGDHEVYLQGTLLYDGSDYDSWAWGGYVDHSGDGKFTVGFELYLHPDDNQDLSKFALVVWPGWYSQEGDWVTGEEFVLPLAIVEPGCTPIGQAQFVPDVVGLSTQRGEESYQGPTSATSTLEGTITLSGFDAEQMGSVLLDYVVVCEGKSTKDGMIRLDPEDFDGETASYSVPLEFDEPGSCEATVSFPEGTPIASAASATTLGTSSRVEASLGEASLLVHDGMIEGSFVADTVSNLCPATLASATVNGNVYSAAGMTLYADLWAHAEGWSPLREGIPVSVEADGSFSLAIEDLESMKYDLYLVLTDGGNIVEFCDAGVLTVNSVPCTSPGGDAGSGDGADGGGVDAGGGGGDKLPATGANSAGFFVVGVAASVAGVLLRRGGPASKR